MNDEMETAEREREEWLTGLSSDELMKVLAFKEESVRHLWAAGDASRASWMEDTIDMCRDILASTTEQK